MRACRLIENVKVAPKLSIVVPAFNEAARLGGSLKQIVRYLSERREQTELIVVDDGSTDNTAVVAEEALRDAGAVATRVIRYEENRGKGYAVRLGLLEAQANIALFSDADLSTPITETPQLVDPIRRSYFRVARARSTLDWRASAVAARARRPGIQSDCTGGDGLAVLGHPMWVQGFSPECLPAVDRSCANRSFRFRC